MFTQILFCGFLVIGQMMWTGSGEQDSCKALQVVVQIVNPCENNLWLC